MKEIIVNNSPSSLLEKILTCRNFIKYYKDFVTLRRRYLGESYKGAIEAALEIVRYPSKTALFYPFYPHPKSTVYKSCVLNKYKISNKLNKRYDFIVHYDDKTFKNKIVIQDRNKRVINNEVNDISKKRIGKIFENVFGYKINVEPEYYEGMMVKKSNLNGVHVGEIVKGPIKEKEIEESKVYQKKVNNSQENGKIVYHRACICDEKIVLVYSKYRDKNKRFSNDNSFVEVSDPEEVFSEKEIEKILKFSRYAKLDFGELDVLRDVKSGEIYIVDVNDTPWGPPNGLPEHQKGMAIGKIASCFGNMVENTS